MKVKLACHVVSNTVAAGINTMIAKQQIDATAAGTSEYLSKFNNLFDILNSRSSKDKCHLRRPHLFAFSKFSIARRV